MSTIAERIAQSLPGASFELETLVRLIGIEETGSVESAAVTCRGRARLLVNPRFVEEYCQRDEYLFLLVMHEMWHVLLGHTTLYERPTLEHNLAFDALINAGLARQHADPAHRGFFESLNPHDVFPALLLRPPVGWPEHPVYDAPGPEGTSAMLRRLYPPMRDGVLEGEAMIEPTYGEILELIRAGASVGALDGVLIGGHGAPDGDDPMADELFGDVVRRIVSKWPPPPLPLHGRDAGGELRPEWVQRRPNPASLRREFARVLGRVLMPSPEGGRRHQRCVERVVVGPGPLLNPTDRLLTARRALLGESVLTNQEIAVTRRVPAAPAKALVYLDVSGSMGSLLLYLTDLLVGPARQGLLAVRQFSTDVAPLTLADLQSGQLTTTLGTDINCVADDLIARRETRALIVTDGYVGEPTRARVRELRARNLQIHVLLPVDGWERDLGGLTGLVTIHRLPELEMHP